MLRLDHLNLAARRATKIFPVTLVGAALASTALCQTHAPVLPAGARDGMSNIGRLVLPSHVQAQYSGAFDPTTGFGYFGSTGNPNPGIVSKVDLRGTLPVIVQDGKPNPVPAGVVNFLTLAVDTSDPDPLNHYIYGGTASGDVVKMAPGDHTQTPRLISILKPKSATGTILCGVIDITSSDPKQHFGYYGLMGSDRITRVIRVRLWDFTEQGAELLNMKTVRSAGIDNIRHYAYFTGMLPQISKVNLATFRDGGNAVAYDLDGTIPGDGIGRKGFDAPFFDEGLVIDEKNGYAYIGTYNMNDKKADTWPNNQAMVVRVKLGSGDGFPAHSVQVLNLRPGERNLSAAVLDDHGNVYFGTDNTYPAHVYKIHVGDGSKPMEESARLDLDPGSLTDYPNDGITTRSTNVDLYGEIFLRSAIIDAAHNTVYFGTDTRPGQVIKIGINGNERHLEQK